ncbi:MAG: pyrroloquinoline quinone-dependent dehydrogenase, partial [Acetobacteraceae bacterium]
MALALAMGLAAPAALAATQPSESGGNVSVASTPTVTADVNVTDAMLNDPGPDNWTNSGNGYSNQRFSTLNEINADNVSKLIPVAIAQTGFTASFETTPVVVNGVMYITTPMVNSKQAVIAMDATTGREMWRYVHDDGLNHICCGPVNRGVVAAYGKVFFVT